MYRQGNSNHNPIRRVILCCEGDSRNPDVWSNVPYMLDSELQKRDVEVIRINLNPPALVKIVWRYTFGILHKIINWNTSYDFFRSKSNEIITTYKMNRAVHNFGKKEAILINLSISHSPTKNKIPTILISDWSYDYYIKHFLNRNPDWSEKNTLARDRNAMSRATINILLFPLSSRRLSKQIPEGSFTYISHIVNVHPEAPMPIPPTAPIQFNQHKCIEPLHIVIIGRSKYLPGLEKLKAALDRLPKYTNFHLDIIGVNQEDQSIFEPEYKNVRFHGYLRKNIEDERNKFYEILKSADLFVNLTPLWGPVSATLEAMFFYTAVITPPYDEFVEMFGSKPEFADYIHTETPDELARLIKEADEKRDVLLKRKLAARSASENHTWHSFTSKLLELASTCRI